MGLLLELLRPYRRMIVIAIAATVVATAAALVPPYLAGLVVNNVIETGSSRDLVMIAIALVAALAVAWVANMVDTRVTGEIGMRTLMGLRDRIVAKLHRLPMSHYDRESTGRMISRMTNDVESLNRLVSGGLNQLASSLLVLVGTIIVMVFLDWRLAVVSLFVFPLLTTLSLLIERRARPGWANASEAMGNVTAYAQEGFAGRDVVRGFGQEQRHIQGFEKISGASEQAFVPPLMAGRLFGPSANFATALAIGAVLVFGAAQVDGGALEVGTVVTFTAYLRQALAPLPQLAGLFSALQQGLTALRQIGELVDAPDDPGQLPGRDPAPELQGRVTVDDVSFAYVEDKWVLRGVDLEIEPGESVAFVGESGCGKSTIVKLMMGFYAPQRGGSCSTAPTCSRSIFQRPARRSDSSPRRPSCSRAPWRRTSSGAATRARRAPRQAAEAVGVLDVLEALPDGLDTRLGEGGAGLSGRATAAGRARASDLRRPAGDDPRRGDLEHRRRHRDAGPAGDRAAHGGANLDRRSPID